MRSHRLTVGVISDAHGLLRPEAVAELRGSDLIVHAGDVGSPKVLEELRPWHPPSPSAATSTAEPGRSRCR